MVDSDFDVLSLDLPPIDTMFNLSPSPATKAMICDENFAVPFLTLDSVVPPVPIDTPMEILPPLLPTLDMSLISSALDQAPCYHVASPF